MGCGGGGNFRGGEGGCKAAKTAVEKSPGTLPTTESQRGGLTA